MSIRPEVWLALALAGCGAPIDGVRSAVQVDGEDTSPAARDFDDATWPIGAVPSSTPRLRTTVRDGTYWYRWRFTTPPGKEPLAVALSDVLGWDRVWVNGQQVGATETHAETWVEPPWLDRLYAIDRGQLRSTEAGPVNVLAIRVAPRVLEPEPWTAGELRLGAMDTLRSARDRRHLIVCAIEGLLLGLLTALGLFAAVLAWRSPSRRGFGVLFAYACCQCVTVVAFGGLGFELGVSGPFLTVAGIALQALLPSLWLVFALRFIGRPLGPWVPAFAAHVLCGVVALATHGAVLVGLYVLWVLGAVLLLGQAGRMLWRAGAESRSLAVGTFACAALVGAFGLVSSRLDTLGLDRQIAPDLAPLALTVLAALTLARRQHRLEQEARETATRLLEAESTERRRLARELHDGIGQSLSLLKVTLDLGPGGASGLPVPQRQVTELVEEVRRVAHDLRPETVERHGLRAAVLRHVAVLREAGHPVAAQMPDDMPELPPLVADTLYRIIQEALANALKHSRAAVITVRIAVANGRLTVTVEDDGCGFDPTVRYEGLGLRTLSERARLLGGGARVTSVPGVGTCVQVEVAAP